MEIDSAVAQLVIAMEDEKIAAGRKTAIRLHLQRWLEETTEATGATPSLKIEDLGTVSMSGDRKPRISLVTGRTITEVKYAQRLRGANEAGEDLAECWIKVPIGSVETAMDLFGITSRDVIWSITPEGEKHAREHLRVDEEGQISDDEDLLCYGDAISVPGMRSLVFRAERAVRDRIAEVERSAAAAMAEELAVEEEAVEEEPDEYPRSMDLVGDHDIPW